ncbi:isochorismate synthase [Salicibibacter cibarius]|uniref:isochorismate synthase n=1 Tax=Salicibibacter cibarius TaxID=2743000 RepID=A0A7T6Z6G3_9BACI|nr:isochorismate synthase [Salicibibacter cibarius]QQK77676.1 isochorismate synthase [Salicibibacter cibarius]
MIKTELKTNPSQHQYRDYSFYLEAPNYTISAHNVTHEIHDYNAHAPLKHQVTDHFEQAKKLGIHSPYIVGAFPFETDKPPYLFIPEKVHITSKSQRTGKKQPLSPFQNAPRLTETPSRKEYMNLVDEALHKMNTSDLKKVVLSRTLQIESDDVIGIDELITNLAEHNPEGYTFSTDLGNEKKLTGASPELLVSLYQGLVTANPLAGSRPRSNDPIEDRRRADELRHSSKDHHEHKLVIDTVAEALQPLCVDMSIPKMPELIQTETMWHLSTEVTGKVDPKQNLTSVDLALALHPTPAICGTPEHLAKDQIKAEPFDRNFFTGMVGWNNYEGDGEWVVSIRCAEVSSHNIQLFAGAGIVEGSHPEDELRETSAKFETMLRAMGSKTME